MAENLAGSILAADFGNVQTRVVLVDLVDGEYRLVAVGQGRTTAGYPVDDVNVGLHRVLNTISELTGRNFIDDEGRIITPEQPDRSGVDHFVATGSAGRPMRAVLVGLMPDISLESAFRSTSNSYVEPVAANHLEDGLDEEERLNEILLNQPDLILITGGVDDGAESAILEMARLVRLAVELTTPSHRPVVVYAGNSALAEDIVTLLGDSTEVLIAANIRPTIDEEEFEPVQFQLARAFDAFSENRGGGFEIIGDMSSTGVSPSAQSYSLVTGYLTKILKTNVVMVDVGSASGVLIGGFGGHAETLIRTDIGLGDSAPALLETVEYEAVAGWIPFNIQERELVNFVMNKSLRPASVPMSLRELYIEHGLLRAGIRYMMGAARERWKGVNLYGPLPEIGLIVGAGSALTGTGHPAYDMLLLLDSVQPTGITQVKVDPIGLLPALGAIARIHPEAVVQLIEGDNLEHLGTVINVSGHPTPEKTAMKLKITTEDGEVYQHEIMGGHLWALPLPAGHELKLDIRLSRGLTINGKRRVKVTVGGGSAGLVFDARGRPLPLADTPRGRAAQMPVWVSEITGDPPQEISDRWLREDVVEEVVEEIVESTGDIALDLDELVAEAPAEAKKEEKKSGGRRWWPFGRRKKESKAKDKGSIADQVGDDVDDDFLELLDDDAEVDLNDIEEEDDELGALRDVLS